MDFIEEFDVVKGCLIYSKIYETIIFFFAVGFDVMVEGVTFVFENCCYLFAVY